MHRQIPLLAIALSMFMPEAYSACYTVTDKLNVTVYQSDVSPIDLSKAITEEIERIFPGGHLVTSIYSCDSNGNFSGEDSESYEIFGETYSSTGTIPRTRRRNPFSQGGQYIGGGSSSSGRTAGTDVTVRSYQRSGQTVQGHTRAAPGRGR